MKKLVAIAALVAMLALVGCAQGQASTSADSSSRSAASASVSSSTAESTDAAVEQSATTAVDDSTESAEAAGSFIISANGKQLEVRLANTNAARALAEHLQTEPVTVDLHPYGGFEQVGPLPWALPESDEQITTSPGDVMLYQGDQITIYYGTNTWSFTRLGRVQELSQAELKDILGDGGVEVTFSLRADAPSAGGEG